jgi:hypothetical protein
VKPSIIRPPLSIPVLLAYLSADRVFLPVESLLLLLGDVTSVLACHGSLFASNLAVFFVKFL